MDRKHTEKCHAVDMKTGMRDCWNFLCEKDHLWRSDEIHNQPERSKREDSPKCEMRCSEHCGDTVREAQ